MIAYKKKSLVLYNNKQRIGLKERIPYVFFNLICILTEGHLVKEMLYYIHGYQSNPTGEKATVFKETLQAIPISYQETIPEKISISRCLDRISKEIRNDPSVVLIGSSLGGFLAASTALNHSTVKQLILLNPAIIPPETDLLKIKDMPLRILQEMINPGLFIQKIPAQITILRGRLDTVVPDQWILRFSKAQNATIQFLDDDHRFSKNLSQLPGIISAILQKEDMNR